MDFRTLIARIDPTVHAALRRAVELGKFPDGTRLTDEQRALCLEAIIAWEHQHLPEAQRVGYIDRGSKADGERCDDDHDHKPVGWRDPS